MTPATHARLQGADEEADSRLMLVAALNDLVPLWLDRVRAWTPEQRCARAGDASGVIGFGGKCDELRGRHGSAPACFALGIPAPEDEAGDVLNAMAMGIALLALQPGGVTLLGRHWEATP